MGRTAQREGGDARDAAVDPDDPDDPDTALLPLTARPGTGPTTGRSTVARARAKRVRRAFIGLIACAALLAAFAGAGLLWMQHHLAANVRRVDHVFTGLHDRPARPAGPAGHAVNILVLGTDRRSDVPTTGRDARAPEWLPGAQRSDTIMVVHIDGDRRGASVVSIPRDSWVQVPGYGSAKINAAFSFAGPSLAVATVEELTGLRIDHLAVIDWAGFEDLTDAIGGVTVTVPQTVTDSARGITWTEGKHRLDGRQALAYVGERYGLPGGDLDRARRQQSFLRTLMESSLHQEMLTDPRMLYDFLDTVTKHLTVDSGWSTRDMARLAMSLHHLRSADIRYLTAPVAGLGWAGDQSIVRLDRRANVRLWSAVRDDRTEEWLARHPGVETPPVVN
jgi:LCP family protein required for cell wall assembly